MSLKRKGPPPKGKTPKRKNPKKETPLKSVTISDVVFPLPRYELFFFLEHSLGGGGRCKGKKKNAVFLIESFQELTIAASEEMERIR